MSSAGRGARSRAHAWKAGGRSRGGRVPRAQWRSPAPGKGRGREPGRAGRREAAAAMGLFGKTPEKPPKELVRPRRRPRRRRRPGGGGGVWLGDGGLGAWRCHGVGRGLRRVWARPGRGTAALGASPHRTRPGAEREAASPQPRGRGEEGLERAGCSSVLCPGVSRRRPGLSSR